jgi:predicted lysophospholipase L1 biosynthesis ABC-type transport system permease subunit
MFSDVKFAARLLLKHPGFTTVATLVLALGIGANTAIFSVVYAVLLRPLPYADQDRIVSLQTLWRSFSGLRSQVSAPDFHDWHDQARSFDAMAAYASGQSSVNVGGVAEATIDRAMSTSRFQTLLLGLFASVALLLAMAGVYGLVSFTVSQRTSELGLRMALGAQPREIVVLTLSSGLRLTLAGIAIGWISSIALARVIASMLFATSAHDPLTFAAVPLLLLVVAALGAMAPAIRAARVDPVVALRTD